MKKEYNRNIMSDMPLDTSFNASTSSSAQKTTSKPKINAIGKKATNEIKGKMLKTNKSVSSTNKDLSQTLKKTTDMLDNLEKLNEESVKTYQTKSKRNKVLIVLLTITIAIAITIISMYLGVTKMQTNCKLYVHGADAVYLIDGQELSEFRAPSNLQGNRILKLNIELKVEDSGLYNIKFKPECFQSGVLLNNTLIYEANLDLFYEAEDGYYYSNNPISGNQTIRLCGGIILDYYYQNTLNVNNFTMNFHTYLEKV